MAYAENIPQPEALPRSVDAGKPRAQNSHHFWIHLELANNHRTPIMANLAKTLINGGHRVTISCEEELAYRFAEGGQVHLRDNTRSIEVHLDSNAPYTLRRINPNTGSKQDTLDETNKAREESLSSLLAQDPPDHIIIWSGNFHYQEGTLAAIAANNLQDKTLYAEVAWFPQQEFLYLDPHGTNYRSTIAASVNQTRHTHALSTQQKAILDLWRDRYITSRFGSSPPPAKPKRIFVPLQVDTDTSIALGSPFNTMAEFVSFLEKWIPDDYEVILKSHPKAMYDYVPSSTRPDFHIIASGSIDEMIATADVVIGLNSTVLLESLALGKKTIAFGHGMFTGTDTIIEAKTTDTLDTLLQQNIDPTVRDHFLYHLVFRCQISLAGLESGNFAHLATRTPFDSFDNFTPPNLGGQLVTHHAQRGTAMIKVGKSKIATTAALDVEKGGTILIGDDCEIRHHAVLEVSGRYNGTIEIGDHCVVGVGNWLQGSGKITLGNDVILGPYVAIVSTNHQYEDTSTPVARQPLTTGEVVIGDDVWVGAHVTIAQNVRIGAHSIIGANSFVNKDIPPYSIVAGAPAKVVKSRKDELTPAE